MREKFYSDNCTGCAACYNICPERCIKMVEDKEGFLYPSINKEKCNNCGLCKKVCEKRFKFKSDIEPLVYALIAKNNDILKKSTSGGAFTILSDYILRNGGIVFGAAYDDELKVVTIGAADFETRDKFRISKYVQSYIGIAYREAEKFLKSKIPVMFSGTPCQISGLYSYLGTDYDNLITIDIVCSGVPSPGIFKNYIRKFNKKIIDYNFRDKKYGWGHDNISIKFENNKLKYLNPKTDIYWGLFVRKIAIRPSCYNCQYTKKSREADITIGDFWGIELTNTNLVTKKGCSQVIINSKKGEVIFNQVKEECIIEKHSLEELTQNPLIKSVKKPKIRDDFFDLYYKKGIKIAAFRFVTIERILGFLKIIK